MNTGINAEARLVALANPKCIKMLNSVTSAIVARSGIESSPKEPNTVSDSHCAPCVLSNTVPNAIPTANTIIVPQGIKRSLHSKYTRRF